MGNPQLNRFPTYSIPLETRGKTTANWFNFFGGLFSGQPTGNVSGITVGSSPFSYVAPSGGRVIIQGGTTTQIQYSRDAQNYFVTGVTAGVIPVSQGDQLVVTYSVAPPTMTFVPQ